jgi:hypothetical protein
LLPPIIEVGFLIPPGDERLPRSPSTILAFFVVGLLASLLLLLEGGIRRLCGVTFWRPVPHLCRRPTPLARGIVGFSFFTTKKCAICRVFCSLQPFGQKMARSYGTDFSVTIHS